MGQRRRRVSNRDSGRVERSDLQRNNRPSGHRDDPFCVVKPACPASPESIAPVLRSDHAGDDPTTVRPAEMNALAAVIGLAGGVLKLDLALWELLHFLAGGSRPVLLARFTPARQIRSACKLCSRSSPA